MFILTRDGDTRKVLQLLTLTGGDVIVDNCKGFTLMQPLFNLVFYKSQLLLLPAVRVC